MNNTTLKLFHKDEKKESRLLNKLDRCRTRKCSKYIKKYNSMYNSFIKGQGIKCPQKSARAFNECSVKLYEGSSTQKLLNKVVKCSDKKCYSQTKRLNAIRKKWQNIAANLQ